MNLPLIKPPMRLNIFCAFLVKIIIILNDYIHYLLNVSCLHTDAQINSLFGESICFYPSGLLGAEHDMEFYYENYAGD